MTWSLVFASRSSLDAQLARAALEGAGISARILGDDRVPGGFGIDFEVQVHVRIDDLGDARQVLGLAPDGGGELSLVQAAGGEVALAKDPATVSLVTCPSCGADWEPGFEVCWSCDYAGSASSPASDGAASPPRSNNR